MDKLGVLIRFNAKAGKEDQLVKFLQSAKFLAAKEPGTTNFCSFRFSPTKFGIFKTFGNEEDAFEHCTGKLVDAYFANAHELAEPNPKVEWFEIVSIKEQGDGPQKGDHSSSGLYWKTSKAARDRWGSPVRRNNP